MDKQERKPKRRGRWLLYLPAWLAALSPKWTARTIMALSQEKRERAIAKAKRLAAQ